MQGSYFRDHSQNARCTRETIPKRWLRRHIYIRSLKYVGRQNMDCRDGLPWWDPYCRNPEEIFSKKCSRDPDKTFVFSIERCGILFVAAGRRPSSLHSAAVIYFNRANPSTP